MESGIKETQVNYRRLGSVLAEFEAIRTASDPIMPATTNYYRVAFLSAASGWCRLITTDTTPGRFGTFDRYYQPRWTGLWAPSSARSGDMYRMILSDTITTRGVDLVFNTPSDALMVRTGGATGGSIQDTDVTYRQASGHWRRSFPWCSHRCRSKPPPTPIP